MGTLADITSKAVNKNLRNAATPTQTPKSTPSRPDINSKANFMTPTTASTKKANPASISKGHTNNATPPSASIDKAVTGKWMTSAAKRVGFRRAGDGTPRPKKEGSKQSHNTLTFPDKLSASSRSLMPDSPRPSKVPASSLSDKPLPSPPIAQIKTCYIEEPRSLIDASEKPLQRTSPKSPQNKEEWPVLFPSKPTSPGTIREMLQQPSPTRQHAFSIDQERYPLLSGSQSPTPNIQQNHMSKVSSSHNIRRKQLSTHGLHEPKTLAGLAKEPNDEAVTQQTPLDSKKLSVESKAAQRLSAGAAAVEKSSTEAKSVKEPRQTRTSSLRARISAGQVIKDSPNKVLGFTDFTAEKTSTAKASNGEGFRTKSSTSFGKAFTKKPSKEFQGGKRAPAQFVAGSRRPVARRSSSRNSLRGDSRAPSPVLLEPSRLAPPIPTAKVAATRKSSIPVSRYSVSSTSAEDDSQSQPTTGPTSRQQTKPSNETSENGGTYHISTKDQGREAFASRPADEDATLESIAESPQSTSNPKRLSIRESGYGYKLKIDPSADRLIMGDEDSDKENQPLMKKKSKDLFRAALINEHKNCAKDHKWASGRPMSSQGFTESQSRNASTATEMRTKKVNSVDLSCVSLGMATTQTEGDNIKKATSPIEDLFSGVTGSRGKNATHTEEQGTAENTRDGVDTVQAISPVKESPTSMSDATTGVLAFMPEILQQDVNKSSFVDGTARVDEVKFCKTVRLDTHLPQASNPNAPSTPQHGTQNNGSPSSGSFPPRSSSRMKHPDYTINGSTTSSSMSPVERAAAQLQKKISLTEPKPSDGEISHEMSNHSQGEISSQTILADVGRKRDSAANESTKSQTSMSKGLMSNFRGLFHKRTSDNIDFPNLRSTKKSSKRPSVTAHGSPFHSLSNIHPVHRPTQASINRNSATSQRPNSNGIAPATPGTPAFASPIPSEVSTTTTLAMEILNSARRETSSPKKERLLELGRLVVDTITQARDAEKAMEEAKQAARKAEVVHALCKKSVSDVAHMVKDWRSDVAHL